MAEARVRVSIEADKNTGAIQAAGEELKGFGEKAVAAGEQAKKGSENIGLMGEASKELAGKIQELVGGAAIAAFFKGAVDASLEEAESLRQVKFAVESTGGSWGKYKEQVDAFAASQMAATQFDDGVTLAVLGKLTRATGDVERGMKATALAQNIAAGTGKDLADTTRIVSDLLTGQERGLKAAQKELGGYVGEAKNGQEALDALQKGFEGAAQNQEGYSKSIAQSKHALEEFQQQVGDGVVPVLDFLLKGVAFVAKGFEELGLVVAGAMAALVVGVTGANDVIEQTLVGNFKLAVTTAKQTGENLKLVAEETGRNIEAVEDRFNTTKVQKAGDTAKLVAKATQSEVEKAAENRKTIQDKLAEDYLKSTEDEFEVARINLVNQVEAARAAGVEKIELKRVEGDETVTLEQFKQARLDEIAADQAKKESANYKKSLAEKKKSEDDQKKLDETRKQNFADTLSFISSLSTSKNKELAIIGKAAAIGTAYINTSVAITKALASAPPPFNFALAAAVGAAGVAQVAAIAGVQLKEGGVTDGTGRGGIAATIGEEGRREAVLPLENERAMRLVGEAISRAGGAGSGGGAGAMIFYNTFNLPGTSALQDPNVMREILEAFAEQMERGLPAASRAAITTVRRAESDTGRAA